jgi:hypothetical protein
VVFDELRRLLALRAIPHRQLRGVGRATSHPIRCKANVEAPGFHHFIQVQGLGHQTRRSQAVKKLDAKKLDAFLTQAR